MKHIIIMLVHLIGIAFGIVLHHIFIVVEGIENRPISSWNMPTLSLDYIFVRWMTAFRPFVIVLAVLLHFSIFYHSLFSLLCFFSFGTSLLWSVTVFDPGKASNVIAFARRRDDSHAINFNIAHGLRKSPINIILPQLSLILSTFYSVSAALLQTDTEYEYRKRFPLSRKKRYSQTEEL